MIAKVGKYYLQNNFKITVSACQIKRENKNMLLGFREHGRKSTYSAAKCQLQVNFDAMRSEISIYLAEIAKFSTYPN